MPIQFSEAGRMARADQVETITGTSARLQLRTGCVPVRLRRPMAASPQRMTPASPERMTPASPVRFVPRPQTRKA